MIGTSCQRNKEYWLQKYGCLEMSDHSWRRHSLCGNLLEAVTEYLLCMCLCTFLCVCICSWALRVYAPLWYHYWRSHLGGFSCPRSVSLHPFCSILLVLEHMLWIMVASYHNSFNYEFEFSAEFTTLPQIPFIERKKMKTAMFKWNAPVVFVVCLFVCLLLF